jgi:hypothetical protein
MTRKQTREIRIFAQMFGREEENRENLRELELRRRAAIDLFTSHRRKLLQQLK